MQEVEILEKLIAIPSISGDESVVGNWLGDFLEKNGFKVDYQDVENGRRNVFAKIGNPKILFFGHMDTVTPVDGWDTNPFSLTVKGDQAFGLGAWDMKGGLACILSAAQSANDMAVLFTVDEEEISKGSWKAIERKNFFEGIQGVVSAEAGNTEGTYGGVGNISYGRQGRLAFKVGKALSAGHAATAKEEWIEWIYKKSQMPKVKSRIVIRNFHATSKGLSMPDKAEMDVDALIHPDEKDVDFQKLLEDHFGAKIELKKRETPYLMPYSFANSEFISKISEIVEKEFGKPALHIGSSVGDENALAILGAPIAIIGPEGRNEHRADEWVSVKSLAQVTNLYRKILLYFA